MNWYSIGLAAVSGGLAALIGRLMFGKEPANKSVHKAVVVILFVAFTVASKLFILPKLNAYQARADVEAAFKDIPAFESLKKYAPDAYRQIANTVVNALERGSSAQEATAQGRTQFQAFLATRLPHASDAAILSYISMMDIEMGELQAKGNGACFQLLFPQRGDSGDLTKLISKETQGKDLAALDEIIKSSNSNRPIPLEKDVMPHVQPTFNALHEKYGASMSMLAKPLAPGNDKEKMCAITRDMFQRIAMLPPEQAGPALRWMFAQN